jgi:hypothetical protein
VTRLGALAALASILAACGALQPPQPPQPDWVANRPPLESCGREHVNVEAAGFDARPRQCVLAAFETGRGAELTSTMTTVEGDPITRILRVHETGPIEVFVDATRDAFGSGEWERLECTRLVPVDEYNAFMGSNLPAELVFIEEGCAPVDP